MKPPICAVCGVRMTGVGEDREAWLVEFADHQPLPEGVVGARRRNR